MQYRTCPSCKGNMVDLYVVKASPALIKIDIGNTRRIYVYHECEKCGLLLAFKTPAQQEMIRLPKEQL